MACLETQGLAGNQEDQIAGHMEDSPGTGAVGDILEGVGRVVVVVEEVVEVVGLVVHGVYPDLAPAASHSVIY